jgi:hypothetical protein
METVQHAAQAAEQEISLRKSRQLAVQHAEQEISLKKSQLHVVQHVAQVTSRNYANLKLPYVKNGSFSLLILRNGRSL